MAISNFVLKYILQCMALPLVHSHSLTYGDTHDQTPLTDPALEFTFLRVIFSNGDEEFFRNWECPDGIWAEDMALSRKPTCVCVKGVYAIGTTLCEENFKILTGDDHCFDVKDMTVRKFIPLLGKNGFAGRANTVFRKDAPYFARLMSATPTTSVQEAMNYVFRMNDPMDFSVYAKLDSAEGARLKCFPGQAVAENPIDAPIMQIAKLPNCSNEFRGPKNWCDEPEYASDYEWTLQIGDSWTPSGQGQTKGQKYPGSCGSASAKSGLAVKKGGAATLQKTQAKPRPKRTVKKKKLTGKAETAAPASLALADINKVPKCDKFNESAMEKPEYDSSASHFFQIDNFATDKSRSFHTASLHQKELAGLNFHLATKLRRFFLDGQKMQNFLKVFNEYKYIQLGKQILQKVCPEEYVPLAAINLLVGTFRLFYWEASKDFPYPIPFNEAEHTRIMDSLNKCKEAAKPIYFMTNNTCPDLGVVATNRTFNESTTLVFYPSLNLSMPGHAAFNFSVVDIPTEVIWKITLLTHYYCTPYFSENPLDLSRFYTRVEAILKNPIMQFRWYYPGQFNRLLQYFLLAYDLEKLAKGLDYCVATAYASSDYVGWMGRPADSLGYDGGRSKLLSHSVGKVINSPTGNSEKAGRRKRFYLQDDIWKKQAYCMQTTTAPYNEVRTSTIPSCKKKPVWFENFN